MAYKQLNFEVETGSYTPVLDAITSSPSVTYTTQSGQYFRFGNLVIVKARILVNTISGGSGPATVSLPFTKGGTSGGGNSIGQALTVGFDWNGTNPYMTPQCGGGTNYVLFTCTKSATGVANSLITGVSNGDEIRFDIIYDIA